MQAISCMRPAGLSAPGARRVLPSATHNVHSVRPIAPRVGVHHLRCAASRKAAEDPVVLTVPAKQQLPAKQVTDKPAPKLVEVLGGVFKGAAVFGLALSLMLGRVMPAEAARSGGRAGGFHGGGMSRSYGGGARSYSGGGSRGYSGGGGGYSGPSYRSGGMGVTVMPRPYFSPFVPIAPPLVGGYGGGVVVAPVVAGPSAVDFALFLMMATVMVGAFASLRSTGGFLGGAEGAGGARQLHMTKVQVGLVAMARDVKNRLDSIADAADTSNSKGLQMLLQETVLALLRNPAYCVYGALKTSTPSSETDLERRFNAASLKERSRFEEETLSNVGGRRARRTMTPRPADPKAVDELIVVTLLVASQGELPLPKRVGSLEELTQALRVLGGLGREQVMGVEVMWTPQADGDYFSRSEIISDYPDLMPL